MAFFRLRRGSCALGERGRTARSCAHVSLGWRIRRAVFFLRGRRGPRVAFRSSWSSRCRLSRHGRPARGGALGERGRRMARLVTLRRPGSIRAAPVWRRRRVPVPSDHVRGRRSESPVGAFPRPAGSGTCARRAVSCTESALFSSDAGRYRGGVSRLSPVARVFVYRAALALLAARFLKVRYRRSVLGFAWTFAYPLLATTVLTVVFAPIFPQLPDFAVYVLVGLLVWHFFSVSCVQAMDALLGSAGVSRKVYVPTAIFPLSAVMANAANLLLCLLAVPVVLFATGGVPRFHPVTLAAGLILLTAFTAGMSLFLSALNVFFHDVRYLFEALLLVWFYATPVVYPVVGSGSAVAVLVALNPLHWIIVVLRSALWSGGALSPLDLAIALLVAGSALAGGWWAFCSAERRFHQYL